MIDQFDGKAGCWAHRWWCNQPGRYVVTIYVGDFFCENVEAVDREKMQELSAARRAFMKNEMQ